MNRTLIAFVIIIVLGLGVLIFATNRGEKGNTPETNILDATAPQSVIIPTVKQSAPMPTFTPITATTATITTAKGVIRLILYPQDAPKAATNFATLAKNKFYDGLTFHRVEPGFVIQGGDPSGNGTGGYSIYGKPFEDELNPETPSYKEGYKEGVLAMANSGPNTNGS